MPVIRYNPRSRQSIKAGFEEIIQIPVPFVRRDHQHRQFKWTSDATGPTLSSDGPRGRFFPFDVLW
jgi:hypothetical protein